MDNETFRTLRRGLGLTQADLAEVLGYASPMSISAVERKSNPLPVPRHVAMLMHAFSSGYKPEGWPKGE